MIEITATEETRVVEADSGPDARYWATQEDPAEIIASLNSRRQDYFQFMFNSGFYERIRRSWNYYHSMFYEDGDADTEIKMGGEEGEYQLVFANQFRAIIDLMVTYIMQAKPSWDAQAANGDATAIEQAKAANRLLDYYEEVGNLESVVEDAIRYALVLTRGYGYQRWDTTKGETINADELTGQIFRTGDIDMEAKHIFQVFFDFAYTDTNKLPWICVHVAENKWDLIAELDPYNGDPDLREKILQAAGKSDPRAAEFQMDATVHKGQHSDVVDTYHFIHLPTPAMPRGRFLKYLGDDTIIEDGPYELPILPVAILSPAKFLMSSWGYSPAFDLTGMQEALNMELSTVTTNHNNLGPTKIWFRNDSHINVDELEPGITVIESDDPPVPLQLSGSQSGFFEALKTFILMMEQTSGMNSVARGQPESSLKSGKALAYVEAKAQQSMNSFEKAVVRFIKSIGNSLLQLFKTHAREPRMMALIGANKRRQVVELSRTDVADVNLVLVKSSNPYYNTLAGRKEIADLHGQYGLIRTPEELDSLLKTGQIETLTQVQDAQNAIVHEENDAMLRGQNPGAASVFDNHVFHIVQHSALLASRAERMNADFVSIVDAHIREHYAQLISPDENGRLIGMEIQGIMGYPLAPHLQAMLQATMGVVPGGGGGPAQAQGQIPGPDGGMPKPEPKKGNQTRPAELDVNRKLKAAEQQQVA